ncbi:MAG TPA: pseudouridine synthase [Prolixibacteraceae bacterium]|nr:pseudouridine synthase [Prolixibacteraceae bacterium]
MRRENRSSRPGGDRQRTPSGGRQAADRQGQDRQGRRPSFGGRPQGRPGPGRDQEGGFQGRRSPVRDQEGGYQGRRSPGRSQDSGFGGRRPAERDNQGRFVRRSSESGRGDREQKFGQRTRTERFPRENRKESGPKKLVLQNARRPSKGELLKELGYPSDHRPNRENSGRRSSAKALEAKGDLIRLNRFISNAGICSRREADTYISAGVVTINGQIVTELGTKVSPDDEVRFDGRLITPERKVYLLLNKPKDFVTTTDDPHATQTVMDLIKDACDERVYPVGRLDRNTTGLLLFTNDGDLAKRLSHPSHQVQKVYQVTLDKTVSVNDFQKIGDGIELEDGLIAADAISFVEGQDKNVIGIEIHSGRNRIVRRIFETLGYRVKALDRVSYAGLTKKNIPRGKWRFLSPPEVNFLKMK